MLSCKMNDLSEQWFHEDDKYKIAVSDNQQWTERFVCVIKNKQFLSALFELWNISTIKTLKISQLNCYTMDERDVAYTK